jgi:hypothetical protein
MKKLLLGFTGILILFLLGGCDWLFGPAVDLVPEKTSLERIESHKSILEARNARLEAAGPEFGDFKSYFMQTFEVEHRSGLNPQTLSAPMPPAKGSFSTKATVPVYSEPEGIDFANPDTGPYEDYPEPDLSTDYVIAEAFGVADDVYQITVTTTYPDGNDTLDQYIEEYYILDEDGNGTWTIDDPIVDDTGAPDQKYRTRMEMHFKDDSVRYETIVKMIYPDAPDLNDSGQEESGFAPFSILGSLDYPDLAYPISDSDALFSSVVVYTHEMSQDYNFNFWEGTDAQDIIGVRYYTEHSVDEGARVKGTIVAYEKTISTLTSQDGTLLDQLQDLFVGSEHDTLAESVFRKEVVFESPEGAIVPEAVDMNSIMRSHVVDISDYTDEEIQLFNDDELKDLDWSGGTYYIPSGIDEEIEDVSTDDELVYYEKEGTLVENPADPTDRLLETIDVTFQGPSDLAVLYRAITDGEVVQTLAGGADDDIPGTLDGEGEINIYDGDIGTSVPADEFPETTIAGTVEAWVYVDKHVNWGGILHKGVLADFSDESFSLQFVDNKGKVAFAIAQQDPSYRYKLVKTNKRLNLDAWYYIVGTWDADNVSVYIFGNGGLVASKSQNNNIGEPYQSDAPLVIGSQLLDEYNSSYGYFGFNGKINGVKVSDVRKTEDELSDFYTDYEPLTANW